MALTLTGDGDITGLAVGALPSNVIGGGAALQVVQATTSSAVTTTSTSLTSTGFSASIVPSSISSKILILMNIQCVWNTSGGMGFSIYRGSLPIFSDATGYGVYVTQSGTRQRIPLIYLDSPSSTSSTTYTLYYRSYTGGTVGICDDSNPSSIVLMEIAG